MKKYFAEFVGTFALTLVVALSLGRNLPLATPVLAGLTLGLFVYSIGHISGTHINPAVTLGAWAIGKIKPITALYYIVAQFIGAYVAAVIAANVMGGIPSSPAASNLAVGLAEALGTLFFTFGIASVIFKKTPEDAFGIVVGGSLALGIMIAAGVGSLGILNPAVAFGIGAPNILTYLLAPIVGSVLGMTLYKYLMEK